MPNPRTAMRKLREILRLFHQNKLSTRQISRSCKVSASTVRNYLGRASAANITWPLTEDVDDAALERLLFPHEHNKVRRLAEPDWALIYLELKKKHVTLMLVWQEYREQHPDGYQYSRFSDLLRRWAQRLSVTMRQTHIAGEKLFVDFSGDGIEIVDLSSGECRIAKLFVAVLGASNYTYIEAVFGEDLPTWIACHIHTFEYFTCVPEIVVPDNLKSGVKRPDYYDPEANRTYAEMARHYGVAVMPARAYKPRDKAKVEQGVLLAQRWVIAVLRHRTFHTLRELNETIREILTRLNDRPLRKINKSRRELFLQIDRPAMKPLPAEPFTLCVWKKAAVNIDYHVEFDQHYYSVHYTQFTSDRRHVEVRGTQTTVEVFWHNKRIASHVRSYIKHEKTTLVVHMPDAHRRQLDWPPSRIEAWANSVGPMAAKMVAEIMRRRPHPQQGYRACLGLIRLRDTYEDARIEAACAHALVHGLYAYQSVKAILKTKRDQVGAPEPELDVGPLPAHRNIRGPKYYN